MQLSSPKIQKEERLGDIEIWKPESVAMTSQGTTLVSFTKGENKLPCVHHTAQSSASPSLGTSQPIASDSRVLLLKVCIIPPPPIFLFFLCGPQKIMHMSADLCVKAIQMKY